LEIHRLLKIGPSATEAIDHGPEHKHEDIHEPLDSQAEAIPVEQVTNGHKPKNFWVSYLIYPVIFVVAFVFFYVVLNFSSLFVQLQGFFTPPQDKQILGENLTEYYGWIGNYYYAVSDREFLDPNNDIDKDGLSNLDEYNIRTNPIVADSDGDGFSDGIEIINGHNPWGDGQFTTEQRKLAEKLDLIMINNRISFNVSQNQGAVLGTKTFNYNLEQPGRLSIPKLNLIVPLVWSKDPTNFDADLTKGVIHYPGTALPGEDGTIYVSGHSSDYLWKKNQYHNVFARLNHLKPGDDVFVDIYGSDGKVFNYRYQVSGSKMYQPDDQTQFIDNTSGSKLNLSTCWPIGTQKDRLVISANSVGL